MKRPGLILTIATLPTLGFSQFVGDSVIVYVDNRVEIKVALPNYGNLKSSDKACSALEMFIKMIPDIKDELSSETADLVRYSHDNSLTVETGDTKLVYLIKNGAVSNTGFRDQAIISIEDFQIYITTADLSKIPELALLNCLEKVIAILPDKKPWSRSLYYECVNENVREIEVKNNDLDFLEINSGAGAGLVKNTWIPDLSFKIALGFRKKGMVRSPYISSTLLFDFPTADAINVNTFLNLGYQWAINAKNAKPDYLGVELGYLIAKEGDLFYKNTMKLGFRWSPVKAVTVSPHLYFKSNFNKVFPGIRVGFGF